MNIGVFGNYGHSNIGDEAILRGLLVLLKDHDVTVFTDDIDLSYSIHGNKSNFKLTRPEVSGRLYLLPLVIISLIKNILSVNVVIIGGGGLFNNINPNAFIQYVFVILLSKFFFRQVYIIGVSVGPLNKNWMKRILRCVSRLVGKVYVRDEKSAKFFQKAKVIPDLAMHAEVQVEHRLNDEEYVVAISAMDINIKGNHLIQKNYRIDLEQFLEHLMSLDLDLSINLLAMDFKRDIEELRHVQQFCLQNNIKNNLTIASSFEDVEKAICNSNLVIATRLHAGILAQLYEIPYLSISYQEKVSNYMFSHGLDKNCVTEDNNSRFNLIETYKNLNTDPQSMKSENLKLKKELSNLSGIIK